MMASNEMILFKKFSRGDRDYMSLEYFSMLKEELLCSICRNVYNDPRVLECLHVGCKDCLDKILIPTTSEDMIIKCATCEHETAVSRVGAGSLPRDYVLNNIVNIYRNGNTQYTLCHSCVGNDDTVCCSVCKMFICYDCLDKHLLTDTLKGHCFLSFEKCFGFTKTAEFHKKIICESHSSKFTTYCITCEIPICGCCAAENHKIPKHKYKCLYEASKNQHKELNNLLSQCESKTNYCAELVQHLRDKIADLHRYADDAKQLIQHETQGSNDLPEWYKAEALKDFENDLSEQESLLAKSCKRVNAILEKYSITYKFIGRLLQHGNMLEVLLLMKIVKAQLLQLTDKKIFEALLGSGVHPDSMKSEQPEVTDVPSNEKSTLEEQISECVEDESWQPEGHVSSTSPEEVIIQSHKTASRKASKNKKCNSKKSDVLKHPEPPISVKHKVAIPRSPLAFNIYPSSPVSVSNKVPIPKALSGSDFHPNSPTSKSYQILISNSSYISNILISTPGSLNYPVSIPKSLNTPNIHPNSLASLDNKVYTPIPLFTPNSHVDSPVPVIPRPSSASSVNLEPSLVTCKEYLPRSLSAPNVHTDCHGSVSNVSPILESPSHPHSLVSVGNEVLSPDTPFTSNDLLNSPASVNSKVSSPRSLPESNSNPDSPASVNNNTFIPLSPSASTTVSSEEVSSTSEEEFSCNQCGKKCFNRFHEKNCKESCKNKKQFKFQCEKCKRRFKYEFSYNEHKLLHSADGAFKCDICGKSYLLTFNLKRHKEQVHNEEMRYGCETCGKNFDTRSSLTRHERKHTKEKPHECKMCFKRFAISRDFVLHLKRHVFY